MLTVSPVLRQHLAGSGYHRPVFRVVADFARCLREPGTDAGCLHGWQQVTAGCSSAGGRAVTGRSGFLQVRTDGLVPGPHC